MTNEKQNKTNEEEVIEETETHSETPAEQIQKGMSAEADSFKELAQRIQADFDNFRKRNSSVRTDSRRDGIQEAVNALLPALDSMEAAAKLYAKDESKKELYEGFDKIIQQFISQLGSIGVTQIESLDMPFDPNLHDAILQQKTDDAKAGTIIEVFRNGYQIDNYVIRHAQVIVAE